MPGDDIRRAAVLGWPISHSLSPRVHGYWLAQYGVAGVYEAIAAPPESLAATLSRLADQGFRGVNLTLPHKETALALMDACDEAATRIGAVNCVSFLEGRCYGQNTDAYGFTANLAAHGVALDGCAALVLGAGGASRAVCAGLLAAGASVRLVNRSDAKAQALAASLGGRIRMHPWSALPQLLMETQVLVNTTSLGMAGQPPLDIALEELPGEAVVTDIVYAPLITPLLAAARMRGHRVVDGLGMLLYQAEPAFAAWFGVTPSVTPALRAHVLEGLA